jgi:hypothetical protein
MRVKGMLLANAADRCAAVRRPILSDLHHMRSPRQVELNSLEKIGFVLQIPSPNSRHTVFLSAASKADAI